MLQNPGIGKLFTKEAESKVPGGVVYLKALTKSQAVLRQNYCVQAASDLRKQLRDKESDAYAEHIAPVLESRDKDKLISTIVDGKRRDLWEKSRKQVTRIDYPEPSEDADIDELIDIHEADEEIEEGIAEARADWVSEQMDAMREEMKSKGLKELRQECEDVVVSNLISRVWTDTFYDATIIFASYEDKKRTKPLLGECESLEDIQSVRDKLDEVVYETIHSDYVELDAWTGEDLKN